MCKDSLPTNERTSKQASKQRSSERCAVGRQGVGGGRASKGATTQRGVTCCCSVYGTSCFEKNDFASKRWVQLLLQQSSSCRLFPDKSKVMAPVLDGNSHETSVKSTPSSKDSGPTRHSTLTLYRSSSSIIHMTIASLPRMG